MEGVSRVMTNFLQHTHSSSLVNLSLIAYLEDPVGSEHSTWYGKLWEYPDARPYLLCPWTVARLAYERGSLDTAE